MSQLFLEFHSVGNVKIQGFFFFSFLQGRKILLSKPIITRVSCSWQCWFVSTRLHGSPAVSLLLCQGSFGARGAGWGGRTRRAVLGDTGCAAEGHRRAHAPRSGPRFCHSWLGGLRLITPSCVPACCIRGVSCEIWVRAWFSRSPLYVHP